MQKKIIIIINIYIYIKEEKKEGKLKFLVNLPH
jgi:hypothetical protein